MYKDFGDSDHHPPCTTALTLVQLQSIKCNIDEVEWYFATCKDFQLSGVSHPFWCDWLYADPSQFPTPEALHYWHHQFWDHDMQWCKHMLGAGELDFQFSVLPPITGFHHFNQGVMKLKQTTGAALDHSEIPKLEFMQSVAPSIHQAGTVIQCASDARVVTIALMAPQPSPLIYIDI
ncbi:hypothetical protein EDC04DRAFT_2612673 [Pisolithus marmoratus]|nr:hypothetical protein EDC04DRAFT_2612673 [Pisolithus marmoratus]